MEGDWREIVRYDCDRDAPGGHDITEEGLHRDVYRDGENLIEGKQIPDPELIDAIEDDPQDLQTPTEIPEKPHMFGGILGAGWSVSNGD